MSRKNTQSLQNKKKVPQTAAGQYGNKDVDRKYDISRLKVPANHYVVRHYSEVKLPSGQVVVDEGANRFQVYDVETFDRMTTQPVKDGKQLPSQFDVLGMNVDILHDPTEGEVAEASEGGEE